MKNPTTWMLAGAIAVAAGCVTSPPARAQEPAEAPTAQEMREAALAAEQSAQAAGADARRSAEQSRQAAAEVRAKLRASGFAGGTPGVSVYARASVKKEKAAYLGVTTSSVTGALREQMKLQRGFGLVVDSVEEKSAASEAGIQQFDILQKFNDQLLVNTQQLSVLARSMKPGDMVTLTLLRTGQPLTVDVTLQEKELPVLGDAGGMWSTEAFPETTLKLMGQAPEAPVIGQGRFEFTPGGTALFEAFSNPGDGEASSSVYSDSDMTLTLTGDNDSRTLVAKDSQGTVLFEGPVATDEQKKGLPGKVAEKLAKFESRLDNIKTTSGKNVRLRVIEP